MKLFPFLLASFLMLIPRAVCSADAPVGSIKTLKGKGYVVTMGKTAEAIIGTRIFRNDTLKTAPDGAMGIVFKDDSLLSLGPGSVVVVSDFLFSPAEGKLSFIARLVKGTSAFLSGLIGRLSPESVRFETPSANVALRGTRFAVSVEGAEGE